MGLAFPAMGYSLIDGKTYRQINLKPTGFFQDHRGQHAPLHASPQGVSLLRYGTPHGGQHAPQQNPSEKAWGSASAVMACLYKTYWQLVLRNQRPSQAVSLLRII